MCGYVTAPSFYSAFAQNSSGAFFNAAPVFHVMKVSFATMHYCQSFQPSGEMPATPTLLSVVTDRSFPTDFKEEFELPDTISNVSEVSPWCE